MSKRSLKVVSRRRRFYRLKTKATAQKQLKRAICREPTCLTISLSKVTDHLCRASEMEAVQSLAATF